MSSIMLLKFSKSRLGLRIGARMRRPVRGGQRSVHLALLPLTLPGETKAVQQLEHTVLLIPNAEPSFDQKAKILGGPTAHAVALDVRSAQHHGAKHRHLPIVEKRRPPRPRSIMQTIDPFGIVADHPIPKRLAIHARLLCSSFTAHDVEGVRNRQEPTDNRRSTSRRAA